MSSASSSASLRPVECDPAGDGLGGAVARPKRRSANPRRHVTRPVRCAPVPRVVPVLVRPAGTPLRPSATASPQPPPRQATTRLRSGIARRRVGAARRLGAGLGSPDKSGSGGPQGPPLRQTAGSPRGVGAFGEPAGKCQLSLARTPPRTAPRSFQLVPASTRAAPTVPALGAPPTRAQELRSLRSLRVARPLLALRLAACVALLRRCTPTASRRSPRLALRRA